MTYSHRRKLWKRILHRWQDRHITAVLRQHRREVERSVARSQVRLLRVDNMRGV